ncbi:MAG: hypothetical protein ABI068_10925 [Ktedonobacterales bacterium]
MDDSYAYTYALAVVYHKCVGTHSSLAPVWRLSGASCGKGDIDTFGAPHVGCMGLLCGRPARRMAAIGAINEEQA